MNKIFKAKSKYGRVYFKMKNDTRQIILPALKTDQTQSIKYRIDVQFIRPNQSYL